MITWQVAVYMLVLGVICVLLAPLTNVWWIILLLGVAVPVTLMAGRTRSAHDDRGSVEARARELLGVIAEHGALTDSEAAQWIGSDVTEASILLERLARQGRLTRLVHNGAAVYALPGNSPDLPASQPASLPNVASGGSMALERGVSPGSSRGTRDLLAPDPTGLGEHEMPRTLGMPDDSHDAVEQPDEPLSEREREVLAVLASGRTTAEAARDLFISVGTVKSHTANIYRKLGAKNRAEAVSRARDLGLLP